MTTSAYSSVLDHTSDAAFRAWGSELSTNIAATGMVQTADTGQINWVTALRPGVNTAGGYEIWRFSDSTIFLKIEYGTSTGANFPQMWSTVGTGSSGTGTLTGQLSTRSIFTTQLSPASTVVAYQSRVCHNTVSAGTVSCAFSLSWKEQFNTNQNGGLLVVGKTVDGTGFPTNVGYGVLRALPSTGQVSFQSVRSVAGAPATYSDLISNFMVPGDIGASNSLTSGGVQQAYQIPMNVPDVLVFNWAAIVLQTEAARGSTLSVAMVGLTTSVNIYVSVGQISTGTFGGNAYVSTRYTIAMIYQ